MEKQRGSRTARRSVPGNEKTHGDEEVQRHIVQRSRVGGARGGVCGKELGSARVRAGRTGEERRRAGLGCEGEEGPGAGDLARAKRDGARGRK